ncbi:type II toxin-antitoxin system Phd/YefM family antitoxin [Actinomyces slackii]|uniref:Antitoxin n=1 Tax=Actinomyces slackii TaxID=52774 RepID=A0A3S4UNA4_9ACTO|nr:type II toxin-antitoxin system prevent-host-death family antitoxin [Actinomyces slackii]VEG74512.1 Antitoxin of toxin-antitoxin stability system [Actinomyces slackii]
MTKQYNVTEAKARLSDLLKRVERGEEVMIARAGKPVARLLGTAGRGIGRDALDRPLGLGDI